MIELMATVVITAELGPAVRLLVPLHLPADSEREDHARLRAHLSPWPISSASRQCRRMLRDTNVADLDRLKDSLDRDYKVLTYLLKHAANPSKGDDAMEKRMLEINYRMMRAWYSGQPRFSPAAAIAGAG